jgi:hypothetical protein
VGAGDGVGRGVGEGPTETEGDGETDVLQAARSITTRVIAHRVRGRARPAGALIIEP